MQQLASPSSVGLDDATLDEVFVASNVPDQTQLGTQPDKQRSLDRFYSVDDTFEGPSGNSLSGIRPFIDTAANKERAATPVSGLIQSNSLYEEGSASPLLRPPGALLISLLNSIQHICIACVCFLTNTPCLKIQQLAGVLSVSSPFGDSDPSPLLAAVLNKTGWIKGGKSFKKDKTAAVLAELRRPAGDDAIRKSARASADDPAAQTSGISAFSQIPVSELSVRLSNTVVSCNSLLLPDTRSSSTHHMLPCAFSKCTFCILAMQPGCGYLCACQAMSSKQA